MDQMKALKQFRLVSDDSTKNVFKMKETEFILHIEALFWYLKDVYIAGFQHMCLITWYSILQLDIASTFFWK